MYMSIYKKIKPAFKQVLSVNYATGSFFIWKNKRRKPASRRGLFTTTIFIMYPFLTALKHPYSDCYKCKRKNNQKNLKGDKTKAKKRAAKKRKYNGTSVVSSRSAHILISFSDILFYSGERILLQK